MPIHIIVVELRAPPVQISVARSRLDIHGGKLERSTEFPCSCVLALDSGHTHPDTLAARLANTVIEASRLCIPQREFLERGSRPWLDNHCLYSVAKKTKCAGAEQLARSQAGCTEALLRAHRISVIRFRGAPAYAAPRFEALVEASPNACGGSCAVAFPCAARQRCVGLQPDREGQYVRGDVHAEVGHPCAAS